MADFERDPDDWLRRLSPDDWVHAGLAELRRAQAAYARGDGRAGSAGVKRAAGMALNGALLVEPDPSWGRSFVDHVRALSRDERVPPALRAACRTVLDAPGPSSEVIVLRTPASREALMEAAKDVIAHAFAVVKRHE